MTRYGLIVWIGPVLGLLSVSYAQNNKSSLACEPAPAPSSGNWATSYLARQRQTESAWLTKDEAIRLALGRTVGEIAYATTPAGEVFKDLRKRLGVNVHVQWQILDDAGVKPDVPITLTLKRVPLERVLRLVLEDLSLDLDCVSEIRDGVLVISSAEALGQAMMIRAHCVRDLLPDPPPTTGEADELESEYGRRVSELMTATVDAVYPDSWVQNGGLGTVCFRDGLLVARNTAQVQGAIEALLATLCRVPKHGRAAVPPATDRLPPQDQSIQSVLQRPLATVSYDETPLAVVFDRLRERLDINIHVHWRRLEDAGVERNTPVRMTLKDVSTARVLKQIFDDSTDALLGYRIDDGVLIISTTEYLDERRDTWVYDLRDLAKTDVDRVELTQLIVDAAEPDSWVQNGGLGTLNFVGPRLVVHNSERAHAKLRILIDLLRKHAAGQPARRMQP
ncbi:MAG TPA: hypothetical protein VM487_24775 [Phycisphaerae bacterium]|nr:hypothetical protein [Phycisphaerae bacterium]